MRYDYQSMDAAVDEMEAAAQRMNTEIDNMFDRALAVIQASDGDSVQSFLQKSQLVRDNLSDMTQQSANSRQYAEQVFAEMRKLDSSLAGQ